MTAYNPNVDLVSINSYIKFGQNLSICSQDIEQKQNFGVNQGHNSGTNEQKMMGNNADLALVNIIAYIKFGEVWSICSQDTEPKGNFGLNQGPLLWYKCAKNVV